MGLDTANEIAGALADRVERNKLPKAKKQAKKPKARKPKTVKSHRPHKESTKTITNRLYSLWASIVRGLAGNKCEVCGRENTPSAPLNAHHIMPRQFFTGLRFDPGNGACLCPKCHKMGKYSAHKGGLWFADWLRRRDCVKYQYCLGHADDELDCKDRARLYSEEYHLHNDYPQFTDPLPWFRVTVLRRDGTEEIHERAAYNKKAAEYIASLAGPSDNPVKGILKVEKLKLADRVPQEVLDAVASDPIPVLHVNN